MVAVGNRDHLVCGSLHHHLSGHLYLVSTTTTVVGHTDVGKVRSRNEDSFTLVPDHGLAVVADGMGGHPGGDVASKVAAESAAGVIQGRLPSLQHLDEQDLTGQLNNTMSESVMTAHAEIRAMGERVPELDGMGTTLTALVIHHPTGTYALGHVGDSRAYLMRRGRLTQLTRDDTWVQERLEASQLTPEQAKKHPFGHLLTQCVGLVDPPQPQVLGGSVETGDAFLLCTDGLIGLVDDEDVERILAEQLNGEPEGSTRAVEALVEAANEAGGFDNITAVLVTVSSSTG